MELLIFPAGVPTMWQARKTWLAAAGVLALSGAAVAYGWNLWACSDESGQLAAAVPTPPQAEIARKAKWETLGTTHLEAPGVLQAALMRMHQEALDEFYSDPRNGLSRMPLVYRKVVRAW